ncbi:hypothetical protein [Streptomyces sp. NRRL F-5193]|uniref:hypothetical protein n=1 Tax=Streptomyces sp. NRRL F-5193 TaxID=1463860 RepID=UPI00131CC13C|nr:hypothetical protein [Streptomyces sp. NRRL F-5193]
MSDDVVGEFHLNGLEEPPEMEGLADEVIAAIKEIECHGFKFAHQKGGLLHFIKSNNREAFYSTTDLRDVLEVANSLRVGILEHEDLSATFDPSSDIFEFAITSYRRPASRYHWSPPKKECGHDFDGGEGGYSFHLSGENGEACVELSPGTPLAEFLHSIHMIPRMRRFRPHTLKVFGDSSEGKTVGFEEARDLVDRLLFELDAAHEVHITTVPRVRRLIRLPASRTASPPAVRFPKVRVPREVSALFSFAGEAIDNPPFMFLAYYQALEYYLPHAASRGGLKAIRRELRALGFDDKSDASVLRVLNCIERHKNANEEDQLKTLVSECVRGDVLREFIASAENLKHFSKGGAELSVPFINLSSTSETLAVQVARRVYALRNRIVHAKDNPRYAESKVLLPRSKEAGLLEKDIQLARLIAIETVVDNQG